MTGYVPTSTFRADADRGQGGGEVVWNDPSTGESFVVDTATGNSRRALGPNEGHMSMPRRTLVARGQGGDGEDEMPLWIGEALSVCFGFKPYLVTDRTIAQANAVYAQKEKTIPVVPCSDAFLSDMRHYELQKQLRYKQTGSQATNSSYRFSRDDLKEAIVVNQVDSKFIACLLPSDVMTDSSNHGLEASSQGAPRTLVLVDQHAADERVRVEWLQREICLAYLRDGDAAGVERIVLDPPVPILLTRHEKLMLQRSSDVRDLFESWGVEFAPIDNIREKGGEADDDYSYSQVVVTTIPGIISNKVRVRLSNSTPVLMDALAVFGR